MAIADRRTGKDARIVFNGGTVESDYRNLDVSRAVDIVEKSAGSDGAKTYITTLKDGTATLEMTYAGGTATNSYLAQFALGTEGTLEWAPQGTATGNPRFRVNAIVIGTNHTSPYNELITYTVDFQFSGTVVSDVFTAVY